MVRTASRPQCASRSGGPADARARRCRTDVNEASAADASRRQSDRPYGRSRRDSIQALPRAPFERQRIRGHRHTPTPAGDIAVKASASRAICVAGSDRCCARAGAPAASRARNGRSTIRRSSAAASALTSPGETRTPHDSSTISIAPPAREATTGRPAASAST